MPLLVRRKPKHLVLPWGLLAVQNRRAHRQKVQAGVDSGDSSSIISNEPKNGTPAHVVVVIIIAVVVLVDDCG